MAIVSSPASSTRRSRGLFRRVTTSKTGWILALVVFAIAALGPFIAPNSPTAIVSTPFALPDSSYPLGTDFLGRDVLSRVLNGGRTVLLVAICATVISYTFGIAIGLLAGFRRGPLDAVLMRSADVVIAFPPLIFVLLLIAGLGSSVPLLIGGIAITLIPNIARVVRAATLETSVRSYVEAAVVRGERTRTILRIEILPNIVPPILADAGIRFTGAILLAAALSFVGLGLQPPAADWALMISENRSGLSLNYWAVAVPAALIALLTIAGNLIADGIARSLGVSVERQRVRA
jgi:ABC-type dipeptide/oligopeptide/nickel transport system permease subunit